jgi:hypothetical protein
LEIVIDGEHGLIKQPALAFGPCPVIGLFRSAVSEQLKHILGDG